MTGLWGRHPTELLEVQKCVLEEMSLMQRLQELSGASQARRRERHAREEELEKDLVALKPIVEPCLACSQKEGSGTGGDRPSGEPQTLSKGLLYPVQLLQGTLGELSPAWVHLHICKA